MAIAVPMPKVGISVESCIITEWLKQPGDKVFAGEILFTYETDKASLECESPADGTLLEVFYGNGDEVPVLQNVCMIGEAGEREAVAEVIAVPKSSSKISPRAKGLAQTQRVDVSKVTATGPHGRVIERDIRAAIEAGGGDNMPAAPTSEYRDTALSGIRKAIAKSMAHSLSTIPQLTHHHSFDATNMLAYRAHIKAIGKSFELPDISLGDMVLFAVSRALLKFPALNAHMIDDNTLRRFRVVHLGFACDTPRGLLVPVIKNANKLSLAEISVEVKRLAAAARDNSISPDDMSGATFTVSNLGTFGVESFTPVINPPQTGVLGIGCIVERPSYPAMGLSLTYDHRAIDGAPAARFVSRVCTILEGELQCMT
jgi:pyruvate dehydrogenase E2 component (dihydrolipoamide acetyltransferase)